MDLNNQKQNLHIRSSIISYIRNFFFENGFIEVDTPVLQLSPGGDRHVRGVKVDIHRDFTEQSITKYLHTSPEFSMKKLLARGHSKIFQICHVFRNGEVSPFHHPEFTLLEWYREGADYNAIMRDTQNLFAALIEKIQPRTKGFFGDFQTQKVAWDKLTICDAFTQYAKMDILSTFAEDGTLYEEKLRREATKSGVYCSKNDHWDDIFYRVLLEKVEPQLSGKPPTFLVDYPLPVGALAKRSGSDRKVCERAELYVCGLEVGNGFSELCDPKEQLERFENDYEYISKVYGKAPPIDYELIEALNSIQSAAGMALGIDRLLMLFTGATDIKEVLWLPMTLGSDQKH